MGRRFFWPRTTNKGKLAADFRRREESKAHGAKRKALGAISRGWRQILIFLRISPQRGRDRRERLFCLSGDDDKQKRISLGDYGPC